MKIENFYNIAILICIALCTVSCDNDEVSKKGFQVREISQDTEGNKVVGLNIDSLKLETRPKNVLLTTNDAHRLIPIYKVNYGKERKNAYTGSNYFHTNWEYSDDDGNNWNNNFMPGFEAMYGYNLVNVSHFNMVTKVENRLFNKPVLIKTLYYPAFTKDTLNFESIKRDFYMASVYDEDTNNDGYISVKDLRNLYYFDIEGKNKQRLIPENYSVMSSEYDSANDVMYVFARDDKNGNGQMETEELIDVFWIDLKNPINVGLQYKTEK